MRPQIVVNNDSAKPASAWLIPDADDTTVGALRGYQSTLTRCLQQAMEWPRWKKNAENFDEWSHKLEQFEDRRHITGEEENNWLQYEARKARNDYVEMWDSYVKQITVATYDRLTRARADFIEGTAQDLRTYGVEMRKAHQFWRAIISIGDEFSSERERVDAEKMFRLTRARYETIARWINVKKH